MDNEDKIYKLVPPPAAGIFGDVRAEIEQHIARAFAIPPHLLMPRAEWQRLKGPRLVVDNTKKP